MDVMIGSFELDVAYFNEKFADVTVSDRSLNSEVWRAASTILDNVRDNNGWGANLIQPAAFLVTYVDFTPEVQHMLFSHAAGEPADFRDTKPECIALLQQVIQYLTLRLTRHRAFDPKPQAAFEDESIYWETVSQFTSSAPRTGPVRRRPQPAKVLSWGSNAQLQQTTEIAVGVLADALGISKGDVLMKHQEEVFHLVCAFAAQAHTP